MRIPESIHVVLILRLSTVLLIFSLLAASCATSKLSRSGQRKIAGKTFVIVGASSGIGRGVAEQLGAYKANVVLAARRTDLLQEVAANVKAAGGQALVVTMDISKEEEVQQLAEATIRQFGDIDVWINMAGVGGIGRFWEIPLEDQLRIVDVNLKGFIQGSYVAVQQFRKQGYGTLINLGSIESINPLAYHAAYAATKGGILNLGEALNQELRLDGHKDIRVVTIEPWALDTPFWQHAANYSGGTPRMAAMDPPRKAVNAVIWTSLHRKKELAVGWKAKGSKFFHNLFPHLTEKISANIVHRYQIKTAPPAPATHGSLHEAMQGGRGVDDGVRARMKQEKKERKKKRD
jgi:short-subunit dehydrogenase